VPRNALAPEDAREVRVIPAGSGRLKRRGVWIVLTVLLVGAGTIGSLFAADAVAHGDAVQSHRAFASSAVGIAATVKLELQHENDLILAARAFVVGNPEASEAQFVQWANTLGALQRDPALQGFGESRIITASQLPAFAAKPVIEAVGASTTPAPFQVIPAGSRPFYCFTVLGLSRNIKESLPPGYDLCAGTGGKALLASRDSGRDGLEPLKAGNTTTLSLLLPIYQGGSMPTTVAARRAAFLGWVGMSLVPNVILDTALGGHGDTSVALRDRSRPSISTTAGPYSPMRGLPVEESSARQAPWPCC
jgi:hypothetical protein